MYAFYALCITMENLCTLGIEAVVAIACVGASQKLCSMQPGGWILGGGMEVLASSYACSFCLPSYAFCPVCLFLYWNMRDLLCASFPATVLKKKSLHACILYHVCDSDWFYHPVHVQKLYIYLYITISFPPAYLPHAPFQRARTALCPCPHLLQHVCLVPCNSMYAHQRWEFCGFALPLVPL